MTSNLEFEGRNEDDDNIIYDWHFVHFLSRFLNLKYLFSRTQDLPGGPGQCWQDHHLVPVPHERGGPHLPNHREQRGGGRLEQHPLYNVGFGRTGVPQDSLEHILLQHRVHLAGGGQHGQGEAVRDQGGAAQDAGE